MKERFAQIFKTKTRDEWTAIFENTDACTTPVLSPAEVAGYAHNEARNSFVTLGGAVQPGPAPRFSRTQSEITSQGAPPGAHTDTGLAAWGIPADRIAQLHESGAII
jgi:alpha-methylacyl-CoA racemase